MINKITYFYVIIYCMTFLVESCSSTPNIPNADIENEIEILDADKITLQIGDTFTIKLHQNGSIGGSNCWINEAKCKSVQEYRKWYVSSLKEKQGYIGCGGSDYWSFKAIMAGVDTIKIKKCPTGLKQKNCSAFQEDSISYLEDITYSPKFNRAIIVQVIN